MTWAKYSTEFSDECADAGLSDRAYRTHSEAISWVYRMEDAKLRVSKNMIRRFAGSDDYELAAEELVKTGFWKDRGDYWVIEHHADVIRASLAAQQQQRTRNKNAQQAHRKRAAASQEGPDVSADVSADISAESASE